MSALQPLAGSVVDAHPSASIQAIDRAHEHVAREARQWVRQDLDMTDAGMAERLHSLLRQHLVFETSSGVWWQWMRDPAVPGVWRWVNQGSEWVSRTVTIGALHGAMRNAEQQAWLEAHPQAVAKTRLPTDRRKNRKNGISAAQQHERSLRKFYARIRNNYGTRAVVDELSRLSHVESMDHVAAGKIPLLNGVVDLSGGMAHFTPYGALPIDLVTRRMPVMWDPDARHESVHRMWSAWPEAESVALRRIFGQALTGVPAKRVVWLRGETNSGRSALQAAMLFLTGDFGKTAPPTVFLPSRSSHDGPLHELMGKRLIMIADAERVRLEGQLKPFTSGGVDHMTTRAPYAPDSIEWTPTGVPIFVSNKAPILDVYDDALTERLVLVHLAQIPADRRDSGLVETLKTSPQARSALLNDLIAAALEAPSGDNDSVRPPSHYAEMWRARSEDAVARWIFNEGSSRDYKQWRETTRAAGLKVDLSEDEWLAKVQIAGRWDGASWAGDPVELYDGYVANCRSRRLRPESMARFRLSLASSRCLGRDRGGEWLQNHWDEWDPWLNAEDAQELFMRAFDAVNDGTTNVVPKPFLTIDPDLWKALVATPVPVASAEAYLSWAARNGTEPIDVEHPAVDWKEATWRCRALDDWEYWHPATARQIEWHDSVREREAREQAEREAAEAQEREAKRLELVKGGAQGGKGSPSLQDGPPRRFAISAQAWDAAAVARERLLRRYSVDPFYPVVLKAIDQAAREGKTEVRVGSVHCFRAPNLAANANLSRVPEDRAELESLR